MLTDKPSEADIRDLYRLLLGREPDYSGLKAWRDAASIGWLVQQFVTSAEFKSRHPHLMVTLSESLPTSPSHDVAPAIRSLIEKIARLHPNGELYQPVYGLDYKHSGPVQRECIERCKLVLARLPQHDHMTLVDVGSNMGYVTFYMAEHFSRVVGIESDDLLFEFSNALRKEIHSRAEFVQRDFYKNFRHEQFDVCLMFSVIHYAVAGIGLHGARKILAEIAAQFDHVFIELSSKKDYPYMPEDPGELLTELTGTRIEKIGVSEKNQRPIYHLKKK